MGDTRISFLILFIALATITNAFHLLSYNCNTRKGLLKSSTIQPSPFSFQLFERTRRPRRNRVEDSNIATEKEVDYVVGEDLPEEIKSYQAIYDMVLVERFSRPLKTAVGLFIPTVCQTNMKNHKSTILK